jgi:ATP-binding cassette, subfamily B, bacterial
MPANSGADCPCEKRFTRAKISKALVTISRMPRVFMLVWNARPILTFSIVAIQLVLGLLPLANVWVLKTLIDTVPLLVHPATGSAMSSAGNPYYTAGGALLLMAFCWLANETMQPTLTYCIDQLHDYLTRDINLAISDKVNSVIDISVLENPKFYDQLQRIQNDLHDKPIQMVVVCARLGQAAITLASLSIVIAVLSPLVVLLITCLAAPKIILQLKQLYEIWEVIDGDVPEVRRMRYYTGVLTNSQDGKEVRLYGLGNYFRGRFLTTFEGFQSRRTEVRKSHMLWNFGLSALSACGSVAGYAYTVFQACGGHMTSGAMALYLGAIAQMESNLAIVAFNVSELYRHALFVGRLFDFLEIKPVIAALPAGSALPVPCPVTEGIEFRDVTFKYPDSERLILKGVSFKIKAGQTVALVGENGAGKTTIVKLLSRFYDPLAGQILVDGIDLRKLDPQEWRARMAVVYQDYSRFQMTVRENIGIGKVDEIDNLPAVKAAAERGGATAMIDRLPDGYETGLGKMFEDRSVGTELSGGEWQKIALARAFMRSFRPAGAHDQDNGCAQLLILDEPTASLDVQSEYDVYCRFHELTEGRSALLITHRFSTVRIADKILVLEDGRVIEEGSHEELMSGKSCYARLYNLQADRYR